MNIIPRKLSCGMALAKFSQSTLPRIKEGMPVVSTQIRFLSTSPPLRQSYNFFRPPQRTKQYVHFDDSKNYEEVKRRRRIILVVIVSASGLYYVTHLEEVPVTERRRFMDMDHNTEVSIGKDTFQQILEKERHHILPQSNRASRIVRAVGSRIAAVAGQTDFEWEFVVVNKPIVNAFCLPGGKVVVFTGLLNIMENEDQLAAVMAHEIAHALARHQAEKMSFGKILMVANVALLFANIDFQLGNLLMRLGLELPFSRKMESEADYIGLQLMARACYNPEQAKNMFANLGKAGGGAPPEWMSTHPAPKTRISDIDKWLPQAEQEREANCSWGGSQEFRRWYQDMKKKY